MILKLVSVLLALGLSGAALAADKAPLMKADVMPPQLQGIGITEKLGQRVNSNLEFKNEDGKSVRIGDYLGSRRPVILSLVYYGCPNLCNFYLNGAFESMKSLGWTPGQEYDFVAVSIDPSETPELAKEKKANYQKQYNVGGTLHFLTGDESAIQELASSVGFNYRWDAETEQWAHTSAAIILTPQGEISRYLHGIMFDDRTFRLSLVEASKNQIGTLLDHAILFCFRFDPNAKKYSIYAYNLMRFAAALTVVLLAIFLIPFWRKNWTAVNLKTQEQGDG